MRCFPPQLNFEGQADLMLKLKSETYGNKNHINL